MNKIKRIYVREIGWVEHKTLISFNYGEPKYKDNGELIITESRNILQGNTIYIKSAIIAIEYYDYK